jgi:hypothetical protein
MTDRKRITVTMSSELFAWCESKSNEYGLSVPALFLVAMAQYKEQNTAMNEMPIILKKLEEMQKNSLNTEV